MTGTVSHTNSVPAPLRAPYVDERAGVVGGSWGPDPARPARPPGSRLVPVQSDSTGSQFAHRLINVVRAVRTAVDAMLRSLPESPTGGTGRTRSELGWFRGEARRRAVAPARRHVDVKDQDARTTRPLPSLWAGS